MAQSETNLRFFSEKNKLDELVKIDDDLRSQRGSLSDFRYASNDKIQGCLPLSKLQKLLPCFKIERDLWEPSVEDLFKSHEVKETRYPKILKFLEHKAFEVLFILTCSLSIFLFLFSEGFLLKSKVLWGVIHFVNALFILGLFSQWLQILIKSKYSKTNQGYTRRDVVYTLVSIFPVDLIVLSIYNLSDKDIDSSFDEWIITVSRLNYMLRIRYIIKYVEAWEDQLVVGDFAMYTLRILFRTAFFLHISACIWHRVACKSFSLKHFRMMPIEATEAVCDEHSWIVILVRDQNPILKKDWHVLISHYLLSLYWAISTICRLGYGDIEINLNSQVEIGILTITQFIAWIFLLADIIGMLTSIFIEMDTERENYLTRRIAIRYYLEFSAVPRQIWKEIKRFYDYLWKRSKGILYLDLIDVMPQTLRADIYYNVNKFVLDELPLFTSLDNSFLMTVSVHMKHTFHLSGEILYRRNELASKMYCVLKGHLEVLSQDESHVIAHIRSGSAIGEIYLLHPFPHVATVRCGTECDIMTLTKENLAKILTVYPEHQQTLRQRLENRFEQSALLITLCEKHNLYPKAFEKLDQSILPEEGSRQGLSNYSNVSKTLQSAIYKDETISKPINDYDGVSITSDVLRKMSTQSKLEKLKRRATLKELQEKAYNALEDDVARAALLCKELQIPRPPLYVTSPFKVPASADVIATRKLHTGKHVGFVHNVLHQLKVTCHVTDMLLWKCFIATIALLVVWYYSYQFGFRNSSMNYLNYIGHFFDLMFAIDFIIDMSRPAIVEKQTLYTYKELYRYRIKTFSFYIRLMAFIPIEYIFSPIFGWKLQISRWFYCLKLNRILELYVTYRVFDTLELYSRKPLLLFIMKFSIIFGFIIHMMAILFEIFINNVIPKDTINHLNHPHGKTAKDYDYSFYWATQVVTSTGYGDIQYKHDAELYLLVVGEIIGVALLAYLIARVSAISANAERRRVSFKNTFYGVQNFMKKRHFPSELWSRVEKYYKLQWASHQGVLTPQDKLIIWDAPRTLIENVTLAQTCSYLQRVPLTMYLPEQTMKDFAKALKQYHVPPGEIILYPGDRQRHLYIIVKGKCQVVFCNQLIGYLDEGKYFGLPGLIFGVNKQYKIQTFTHCHFFCLNFEDFAEVAKKNPKLLREYRILRREERFQTGNQELINPADMEIPYPAAVMSTPQSSVLSILPQTLPQTCQTRICDMLKGCLLSQSVAPNGTFFKYWTIFRTMIAIFVTIFVPIQMAFSVHPRTSMLIIIFCDIVAWIDIYLMLHLAYFGNENQLITNPFKTAYNYTKGLLVVDLIACLPFDYIVLAIIKAEHPFSSSDFNFHNKYNVVSASRLNRIIQCYRFCLAGGILRKTIYKSLTFLTLVEIIPLMFIFMNYLTCAAVLIVCGQSKDGHHLKNCSKDAWITIGSIYDYDEVNKVLQSTFRTYVIGFYWTVTSALCVGFGDIDLETALNRSIAVAVVFFGMIVSTLLGCKLTACMVGEDSRRIAIREKMKVMFQYLEQYKVSRELRRRVKAHFFSAWDKTLGIYPHDLFMSLHPTLKTDVMRQLYETKIRKAPIFQNLDDSAIRLLSSKLHEEYYNEGEYIMAYGDMNDDIFIIYNGIAASYNLVGKVMCYLGPGSIIGEIAALYDVQRLHTVIAATDVEVLVIRKVHFVNFLNMYPGHKDILEKTSLIHYKETVEDALKDSGLEVVIPISTEGSFSEEFLQQFEEGKELPVIKPKEELKIAITVTDSNQTTSISEEKEESEIVVKSTYIDPIRCLVTEEDDRLSKRSDAISANNRWWSLFITFGKIPRTEMGLIHIVQELDKCSFMNFTIHPSSPIPSLASLFLFLTAISCGLTAYEIAFSRVYQNEIISLNYMRHALEVFFIIRILGNFRLSYYDDTNTLVTSVKRIFKRYATKYDGLILDLITTFPFYLFANLLSEKNSAMYAADIRGLQILRVVLFFRYLHETEMDLRMKASRVKIIKVTILLCFIFHFCACIWYLAACYDATCKPDSWMTIVLTKFKNDSVIIVDEEVSVGLRYLLSLYYVTTAITFTGLSQVSARTMDEIILTICFVFSTVFVIGFLVGEMTQCLASQVASKIHYQHELSVLESHFWTLGLSDEKIHEIRNYFRLLWTKFRGHSYYDIMEELPYSLRADVAYEIYGVNMRSTRILGKLEDTVIRQLCVRIRHEVYMPGRHIIRSGDVCESMYFIKKGEVVILDENSHFGLCVEILYENEVFGEVRILLPREPFRFSYIARLETEVGVLFRSDLEEVVSKYPTLHEELTARAIKVKNHRATLKHLEETSPGTIGKNESNSPQNKTTGSRHIRFSETKSLGNSSVKK